MTGTSKNSWKIRLPRCGWRRNFELAGGAERPCLFYLERCPDAVAHGDVSALPCVSSFDPEAGMQVVAHGRLTSTNRAATTSFWPRPRTQRRRCAAGRPSSSKNGCSRRGCLTSQTSLPLVPQRIGVVTPTGAAIRDYSGGPSPPGTCAYLFYPAHVRAKRPCLTSCRDCRLKCLASQLDVLIVRRGGGSLKTSGPLMKKGRACHCHLGDRSFLP